MTLVQQMLAPAAVAAEPHHRPLPIMFISVHYPLLRRDALPKRKARRALNRNGDLHGAPHSSDARFESAAGGQLDVSLRDLFRKQKKEPEPASEMRVIRISEEEFLQNPEKFQAELGGPTPVILYGRHGEVRTIIGITPGITGPDPEPLPTMPARPAMVVNQRAWLD